MRHLAGVPVPGPGDVLGAARSIAGWSTEALGVAASLPQRAAAVLDEIDALLRRVAELAGRAEAIIERAGTIAAKTEATIGVADNLIKQSSAVTIEVQHTVAAAAAATDDVTEIVATYRPLTQRAAPLAQRFVEELSEDEVHAAIRLIDQLPVLTERLERDILPVLATLEGVGPDVHELVAVLKEVRQAIHGVPGFRFFRRRGEEAEAEEQQVRG